MRKICRETEKMLLSHLKFFPPLWLNCILFIKLNILNIKEMCHTILWPHHITAIFEEIQREQTKITLNALKMKESIYF